MHETRWIEDYIAPLVTAPGADQLQDDVARLSAPGIMIATMDTLVERVHFLPTDPLDTVGQKLVRVNVSDIYAKGARPVEALLSIAWPKSLPEAEFGALMTGLRRDLEAYEIALIGGDLVGTEGPLTLTMTLTGMCFGAEPVRRSGGRAGQSLLVSGEIGWGSLGLAAAKTLEAGDSMQRYRVPAISCETDARGVAEAASAAMDVSDGLLIDAARLGRASDCGVEIELERVPLAQVTDNVEKILNMCAAGDDYCLLISADDPERFPGFVQIGILTSEPGLRAYFRGQNVNLPSTLGFEH